MKSIVIIIIIRIIILIHVVETLLHDEIKVHQHALGLLHLVADDSVGELKVIHQCVERLSDLLQLALEAVAVVIINLERRRKSRDNVRLVHLHVGGHRLGQDFSRQVLVLVLLLLWIFSSKLPFEGHRRVGVGEIRRQRILAMQLSS